MTGMARGIKRDRPDAAFRAQSRRLLQARRRTGPRAVPARKTAPSAAAFRSHSAERRTIETGTPDSAHVNQRTVTAIPIGTPHFGIEDRSASLGCCLCKAGNKYVIAQII
jgi:hypothetical protein